ncbi:hypothetical protein C0L83_002685, partial [Clostridium perfringens]
KEIAYEDKVIKKLVIWNNNLNRQAYPSLNTASNKDVNNSPNTQSDNKDKSYKCTGCGKEVPYKVAEFSYKKLGKVLCMDCQKKVN